MPWFQPQHLHLVPAVQMAALLRECGFEPVEWQTGAAHAPNDFMLSAAVLMQRLVPKVNVPWRPRASVLRKLLGGVMWALATPLILGAALLDRLAAPLARRLHHVSQFRVIARCAGSR